MAALVPTLVGWRSIRRDEVFQGDPGGVFFQFGKWMKSENVWNGVVPTFEGFPQVFSFKLGKVWCHFWIADDAHNIE